MHSFSVHTIGKMALKFVFLFLLLLLCLDVTLYFESRCSAKGDGSVCL